MKMKFLTLFAIGCSLFTSVACQRSSDAPAAANDSTQVVYLGDLDKKMSDIYSKDNEPRMDVCDLQWRDRILEISRVLEQKRSEIEVLAKQNPTSAAAVVKFGSYSFFDDTAIPPGEDKWTDAIRSWSRIAKIYSSIKNSPQDSRWVTVNRMARSMVSDDTSRITNGNFMGLGRTAGPMISGIDAKLQACLTDQTCMKPGLSEAEISFLNSNIIYSYYIYVLFRSSQSLDEKRVLVAKFAKRIHSNAARYGFHKNSTARVDGNTLIVPMDLSNLGDGASAFAEYIEKTWNNNGTFSVKVESVQNPTPSYLVNVSEALGGRANVNSDKRLMQLFNWGTIKTFTHEFGHVVGFTDNYYTTWSIDTCAYTQESNGLDLMSNSTIGVVLPAHWDAIKKAYWNQ